MNLNNNKRTFLKVAHRGVPTQVPENTMASFKYALQFNIDMLEIDVHRTKDGQLVVIHDPTTDRTALKSGEVGALTYDALFEYDVGKWKGEAFVGERIPLFRDVLKLIRPYKVKLLIEIKKPERYEGIEQEVLDEIKANGIREEQVIIQSFNKNSMKKMRSINKTIELGVLLSRRNRFISKHAIEKISAYAQYLNPNYMITTSKMIDYAHTYQLKVLPYTVNDKEAMDKLLKMGVDGLITDAVNLLEEIE